MRSDHQQGNGCDAWQVRLAKAVCTKRKLNATVAALFAEGAPGEVVLPECTQLAEADMASLMRGCSTPM